MADFNGGLRAEPSAAPPMPGIDTRVRGGGKLICHDSLNFERTNHNDKPNDNSSTESSAGSIHLRRHSRLSVEGARAGESVGESGRLVATLNWYERRPLLAMQASQGPGGPPMSTDAGSQVGPPAAAAIVAHWHHQQCHRNTHNCSPSSWTAPAAEGSARQQVSSRQTASRGAQGCGGGGGGGGGSGSRQRVYSYLACMTLLAITAIQLFVAVPAVEGYVSSAPPAPQDSPDGPVFNDPSCATARARLAADSDSELGQRWLLVLRCDFKPLVETFEGLLRALGSSGAADSATPAEPPDTAAHQLRNRLGLIAASIEPFYQEAMFIYSRKDFCTYPVVERFSRLRELGHDLLESVYDVLAIDFHKSCLVEVIGRLPQVPYLVRDVVEIYMGDAASALPDLNSKPRVFTEASEEMDQFDVGQALARNGPLEQVIELVLMPGLSSGSVQSFRDKCKEFLIEIDERWQSMEMMSRLLSTDTNGIQRFNNFVMRQLVPTKYADICSQLSRAS